MKITTTIVRILFGALFVFSAVVMLFNVPMEQPKLSEAATSFMGGLMATGYFIKFLKITELVLGLLLIINRWAPLATVAIFPIVINILLYHAFLTPANEVIIPILLLLANLYLAYQYRENYKGLLMQKPI
jgi:putative oxidoreductase